MTESCSFCSQQVTDTTQVVTIDNGPGSLWDALYQGFWCTNCGGVWANEHQRTHNYMAYKAAKKANR